MRMRLLIIWQDVEMTFGQNTLLQTVIFGDLSPVLLDLRITHNVSSTQILPKLAKDQAKSIQEFHMDLKISIAREAWALGLTPFS